MTVNHVRCEGTVVRWNNDLGEGILAERTRARGQRLGRPPALTPEQVAHGREALIAAYAETAELTTAALSTTTGDSR